MLQAVAVIQHVRPLTSDWYLDGGVALPVLLTGGSWEAAMRWPLTAVPEPEATLREGRTGHVTTCAHQVLAVAAGEFYLFGLLGDLQERPVHCNTTNIKQCSCGQKGQPPPQRVPKQQHMIHISVISRSFCPK